VIEEGRAMVDNLCRNCAQWKTSNNAMIYGFSEVRFCQLTGKWKFEDDYQCAMSWEENHEG
jgi:hypothetical protein